MRCPDDEKFAQYAEEKLNGDERAELLLHLSKCLECSTLYAMTYRRTDEPAGVCPDEEKTQSEKTAVRRYTAKFGNYRLVAIAAIITLVIGLAGVNTLNNYSNNGSIDLHALQEIAHFDESADLPVDAPLSISARYNADEAPNMGGSLKPVESIRLEAAAPSMSKAQENKQDVAYDIIYIGHDGDEAEITRVIMSITGSDDHSARTIAKSGSIVIKSCDSIEEAQRIKEEMELAGARIEIKTNRR